MKRIITIAFSFIVFITISTQAQHKHGINHRQINQRVRIHHGVASGEITRKEAVRLRTEQRFIRRSEQCAKADGRFSPRERARLHRMQNHASRDIYRQKHDVQHRPKAI